MKRRFGRASSRTDEELVAAFSDSAAPPVDRDAALAELLGRYERCIMGPIVYRLGPTDPSAADVRQRICVTIWRSARSCRGPLAPWIRRVAANEVTNELRHRLRSPVFSPLRPPSAEFERIDELSVAPCVLSKLSDREREIIGLVLSGASTSEIAETMFISANSVSKTVLRVVEACERARRECEE